uniref:Uncharacterized protein n=1 Tax=Rhizophora mucronata TaxID=61149 RepID=A0A2P2NIP1_RHIMU
MKNTRILNDLSCKDSTSIHETELYCFIFQCTQRKRAMLSSISYSYERK